MILHSIVNWNIRNGELWEKVKGKKVKGKGAINEIGKDPG
jgi:hypothetical protein